MSNLITFLDNDKVKHFIYGYCISITLGYFSFYNAGVLTSTAVGIAKERWDKYHPPHKSDPLDALATFIGGFAAYALHFLK